MAAAKLNLKIEQGAKFNKQLIWQDPSKIAISLAGYLGRMQIRETIESATVAVALTTENGGIVLENDGVTGQVDIIIGAVETESITFTNGVYDLELYSSTDPDDVVRLIEGIVTIIPNVTR